MASSLEKRFQLVWRSIGGPELVEEHRFHPTRKWRADFAHMDSRTLIEIEGGIYQYGRHNRASGMVLDFEKYLEAQLHGWRVIRLYDKQLTPEILTRVKNLIDEMSGSQLLDMV